MAIERTVNALERPGAAANPRFVPDCAGATYGRDPDAPVTSRRYRLR